MNRVEALWKSLFGSPTPVEDATYEVLFSGEYADDEAYPELIKRLSPIVRAMAHCDDPFTADEVTKAIFIEFTDQFPGAPEEEGLLRLASVIRNRIGVAAFYAHGQARIYYTQLALYHVASLELRHCLQMMFHRGLNRREDQSLCQELASVLQVSPEQIAERLRRGWQELCSVMHKELNAAKLEKWTEGALPWPCLDGDLL